MNLPGAYLFSVLKFPNPVRTAIGLMLAFVLLFSACDEEVPPIPGNPGDLVFEGQWLGNTSQMKLVGFGIANINDHAYVLNLNMGYFVDTLYKQRNYSNVEGLAEIINGAFTIGLSDGGILSGRFLSESVSEGSFTIFDEISGNYQSQSYTALSDSNQISLNSIARLSFTADGTHYDLVQDFDWYFPETENIPGKKGNIVGATFSHKSNTYKGKKHLWIKAGRAYFPEDIPELFAPGIKNYSLNAGNGFEIVFYDPESHFLEYSTSKHFGNQEGSRFEILEFEEIDTGDAGYKLYKFMATFNCRVYRKWGDQKTIDQGFMIGYIDTRTL